MECAAADAELAGGFGTVVTVAGEAAADAFGFEFCQGQVGRKKIRVTGMGRLIKYIPWPVTSGFTTGIAVAILLTQWNPSTTAANVAPGRIY